jgi:predicted nuclease of predicted toxin-antitoxin system
MNFLVDAQLPRRLVYRLREAGHDAIHTLDLPEQNRTTDAAICALAEVENRVVVTKDVDFVDTFLVSGTPPKLLLVTTGNISNAQLERLLLSNLPMIVRFLADAHFVELARSSIIVHG